MYSQINVINEQINIVHVHVSVIITDPQLLAMQGFHKEDSNQFNVIKSDCDSLYINRK